MVDHDVGDALLKAMLCEVNRQYWEILYRWGLFRPQERATSQRPFCVWPFVTVANKKCDLSLTPSFPVDIP